MTSSVFSLLRYTRTHAPVFAAFGIFISVAIPSSIINVAWDYIYPELNQPYDALGILLLFFTTGRLASTFIAGRIIARMGLWRSVMTGMLLSCFGLAGALISPSWPVLLAVLAVFAFGCGVMDIGINLYITSNFRSGIINFLHASYGLGLTVGPLIVSLIVMTLGLNWRMTYLVPLAVVSSLAVWTFFSRSQWRLPARTREALAEGAEQPAEMAVASIRATLTQPVMWAWLLFALMYGGLEVGTGQLSNDLLTKSRGLDTATASTWISLYYAAFTAGRFFSGFIATRFSEAQLIFGAVGFALVGAALIFIPSLALTLPGLLLVGVALSGVFPTLVTAVPRRFGFDHAPNAIGFTVGMAGMGTAIMPGLGAFLAARTDFTVIGPYLFALAVALVLSYVLVYRLTLRQA